MSRELTDPASIAGHQLQQARRGGNVGDSAADAREKATVFMAAHIAHQSPRDERGALKTLLATCENPIFADRARYRLPRKNRRAGTETVISGPSVQLAREIARCLGNMRTGIDIVSIEREHIVIQGWAWDIERNLFHSTPDTFKRVIQRYNEHTGETRWEDADENQLRELVNRRGAFCERNSILKIVPQHIVAAAEAAAEATRAKASQEVTQAKPSERQVFVAKVLKFFAKHGVDRARLEREFGAKLEELGEDDVTTLREQRASIEDGTPATQFYPAENPPTEKLADQQTGDKLFDNSNPTTEPEL